MMPTGNDVPARVRAVLITGAAGGLGHRLCRILWDRGFQVYGLVRPADDCRRLQLPEERVHVGRIKVV